jgi:hypothetical protein
MMITTCWIFEIPSAFAPGAELDELGGLIVGVLLAVQAAASRLMTARMIELRPAID